MWRSYGLLGSTVNVAMLVFSANATEWDEQPPATCHFAKREPYDAADKARTTARGKLCLFCLHFHR